jgi:hypothetical protein
VASRLIEREKIQRGKDDQRTLVISLINEHNLPDIVAGRYIAVTRCIIWRFDARICASEIFFIVDTRAFSICLRSSCSLCPFTAPYQESLSAFIFELLIFLLFPAIARKKIQSRRIVRAMRDR